MQPHYETYVSYNADATYLYSDVVVDGYTSQNGPSSGCNISGSSHRPQIYHTLNGQGGTYYGPSVYPLSYVSFDNEQQAIADVNTDFFDDVTGTVQCSAVGTIFSSGFFENRPALANCTGTLSAGPDSTGTCFYNAICGDRLRTYQEIQDFTLSLIRSYTPDPRCAAVTNWCPSGITSWEINIGVVSKHTISGCTDSGVPH